MDKDCLRITVNMIAGVLISTVRRLDLCRFDIVGPDWNVRVLPLAVTRLLSLMPTSGLRRTSPQKRGWLASLRWISVAGVVTLGIIEGRLCSICIR